jgi:hypothetical protein
MAQQVYQSGHYGSPGTQYLYSRHSMGFTNDEIITSGPDLTWDVSHLPASDLDVWEIVTRDQEIDGLTFTLLCGLGGLDAFTCLNIYNSTQQAWVQTDTQTLIQFELTDITSFQRKTSQYLLETFFGFTVDLNGSPLSAVIVYPSPDTILQFPVTFGDSLSSFTTWMIDLSPTGQNIQYRSRQHRTTKVDGWGDLITPFDTLHDLLRVRAVIERRDSLFTDTLDLPVNITQVEYTWYDTAYGLPVMIANGFLLDSLESVAAVNYLVDAECSAPTWNATSDADVYYSDENGNATAQFTIETSNADTYSWNFGDGNIESSTGDISHIYSGPGVYTVIVTGCMTNCLPLNSCTTDTLQIEVLDTTSAVIYLDPGAHGIRVFPNPARSTVTIEVTGSHFSKTPNYQVLDVYGRIVREGMTRSATTDIDVTSLPGGVYLINLIQPGRGIRFAALPILVMH